ncbi:MAG TPA: hypothetical protein VLA53_06055 [Nitrosopumilaceae archaeon]|nr:hypothetical protein [Nitrosopumilaceae archaeon]
MKQHSIKTNKQKITMNLDDGILSRLTKDSTKREYHLYYQDKGYSLEDVTIAKSAMPVNKPTSRGGLYFVSDKEYKIKGTVRDLSILPFISKMMLGPNEEFQEIPIKTQLEIDGKNRSCTILVYLTNTMNNSSKIIFNMLIIGTKIE